VDNVIFLLNQLLHSHILLLVALPLLHQISSQLRHHFFKPLVRLQKLRGMRFQ
jgi:hypothetical protein